MKLAHLKKVRVAFSLIVLLLISLVFVDFSGTTLSALNQYLTYLQFIPSMLKFTAIGGIAAAGFIFVIVVSLLFGRVYCSTICPLGILQDVIAWFPSRKKKKRRYKNSKPYNRLRYSLLVVSILVLLTGSVYALNLLDPFSNYGRISVNLFRPVIIYTNNLIAALFESFDNYSVSPVDFKGIEVPALIFTSGMFLLIFWLAFRHGRRFCNTVCPVGTFLGFLSKFSVFRIAINEETCKGCGVCEKVCKAECIDSKTKEVDFTRCVSCFNCFDVCPTDGLKYSYKFTYRKKSSQRESKREFLKSTALYLMGFSFIARAQEKIKVYTENKTVPGRTNPITPPGSSGIESFNDKCTACHLCVSACPTQVLQPSFLEYGFTGMLQPRMDNIKGFCNYDCTICGEVCPNGAILPLLVETKKLTQVGKAKFIKDNCVVETQGTNCGACAEHCPTKAVRMVPYKNRTIPEVTEKYCIGCGACEYACPTKPYKAIFVDGNEIHVLAEKPEGSDEQRKVDLTEEFPF